MKRLSHLSYIHRMQGDRVRLSRPFGNPVRGFDHLEYHTYSSDKRSINSLCELISQNLHPKYVSVQHKKTKQNKLSHPHDGLCVVATMSFLYLTNSERFIPYSAKLTSSTHWWVYDSENDVQIDLTGGQYEQNTLDQFYTCGRPSSYYGWKQRPAARFLDFIESSVTDSTRYRIVV